MHVLCKISVVRYSAAAAVDYAESRILQGLGWKEEFRDCLE
jgi:hypothetical protein